MGAQFKRRTRAGSKGRALAVRDHVCLRSNPGIVGVVIALDRSQRPRAKVLWSQYTSTWNNVASLVVRVRQSHQAQFAGQK
jgi:hypothetical protein